MAKYCALCVILGVWLWAIPAHGQTTACTSEMTVAQLTQLASSLLRDHPLDSARCNDLAHNQRPHYMMLFGAAMAYEQASRTQPGLAALAFARYQTWLNSRENVPERERLEPPNALERARAFIRSYQAVANPTPSNPAPDTGSPTEPTRTPAVANRVLNPATTPTVHPPTVSHRFPLGPALLLGLGAVALGFGAYSGIVAEQYRGEVQNAHVWTPEVESSYLGIERARWGMGISLGVGAALGVIGVIWLLAGHWTRTESPRPSVTPVIGLNQLSLQASF